MKTMRYQRAIFLLLSLVQHSCYSALQENKENQVQKNVQSISNTIMGQSFNCINLTSGESWRTREAGGLTVVSSL
ncbi:MAG: hypothetical protein WCT20_04895 [Candidatus Babeliales bacterium]